MPTSGHNGSDSFAALIEEWPEYGVAARQGYDAFFRLLGDRNINATSLERLDPHIVHDGASVPVASVDSCVCNTPCGAESIRGLQAIVAKIIAARADRFVVGAWFPARARAHGHRGAEALRAALELQRGDRPASCCSLEVPDRRLLPVGLPAQRQGGPDGILVAGRAGAAPRRARVDFRNLCIVLSASALSARQGLLLPLQSLLRSSRTSRRLQPALSSATCARRAVLALVVLVPAGLSRSRPWPARTRATA